MLSNLLYSICFLLIFLISDAYSAQKRYEDMVIRRGVNPETPTKTSLGIAARRLTTEGWGAVDEVIQQQAEAERKRREIKEAQIKEEVAREIEEIKRVEAERSFRAIEVIRREEQEKRAEETGESQRRLEEALRIKDEEHALESKKNEQLFQEKLHIEKERRIQEKEEYERRLAEAKHVVSMDSEKRTQGDGGDYSTSNVEELFKAKIAELEQEKNELITALASLRGGQVEVPKGKSIFITYAESFIHDQNLKPPATDLDMQLEQKLESIQINVDSLLLAVDSDTKLRAVQRNLVKRQFGRLKEGAENFDALVFLRIFGEVKAQLTNFANNQLFLEIEAVATWLESNKAELSKAGDHRIYLERQLEVRRLVDQKRAEFEEFYKDYLDRVVAEMCVWLSPVATDGASVQNAKRDFRSKMQTGSIPTLKSYLSGQMPIFGTTDSFLNFTFVSVGKGKEYGDFKEVLQAYYAIFSSLGDNAKLVEELLNYEFFQDRFRVCRSVLQQFDLSHIGDAKVRELIQQMKDVDVLNFNETRTSIFAAKVNGALADYTSKISIDPNENLIENEIEKILIAYTQIDAFANKLRAGNPKVGEFHSLGGGLKF
jgi:hypothetical protein